MAYQLKPHQQVLKPLTKQPACFEIGAFDIEGVGGPNGFINGGLLLNDEYFYFESPVQMIEKMKERQYKGYRIFAHNLTYDYGILEPWLTKLDYPLLINGRPFKVRLTRDGNNPRYLMDSLLFSAGQSLKRIGDVVSVPKLETPHELKIVGTLTYAKRLELLSSLQNLGEYLERDVRIAQAYMRLFQSTINELGGEMRFTLASTAMDLFRRAYLRQEFRTPFEARNDFARQAYYGGRVEPYKLGVWTNVNVYDVNSLYPYVMANYEYPDPNYLHGPTDDTSLSLIRNYEGVSDVTISLPDTYIPPLPYRHDGKLLFPVGLLRGTYTHVELRHALDNGAKIKQIHQTLYSTQTCSPFKDYVNDLYTLRLQYKASNDPRELVIKILLNSLYGKFGQRSEAGLQEIRDFLWWYEGHQDIPVTFREIDNKLWVVVDKHTPFQPAYVNTLWASYITAYARLVLLKFMVSAGDTLLYCDTDSIFTTLELETSTELGGLKKENDNVDIEILAPKAYLILKEDTVIKEKCKGVPADNRLEFLLTGQTKFTRPIGLLEAGHLKPKQSGEPYYVSEWREVVKKENDVFPKRKITRSFRSPFDRSLTVAHRVRDLS